MYRQKLGQQLPGNGGDKWVREEGMTTNGHEVSFWDDEKILKQDCIDGTQLCKFNSLNELNE